MTPGELIEREIGIKTARDGMCSGFRMSPADMDKLARYILKVIAIDTPMIAKETERTMEFHDIQRSR